MKVLLLAWRNVWRNTRRTFLSIGIIAVGVAALLVAWGFVSATFWGLRELTISTGLGHLQIGSPRSFDPAVYFEDKGLDAKTAREIQDLVEVRPLVRFAMQRVNLEGLVSFGRKTVAFVGTGIEPAKEARLSGVFAPIVEGENLPIEGYFTLVAAGLAKSLGCHPGDVITVLVNLPSGGLNALDLEVAGIYETGFPETDKRNLLLPLAVSQELLGSQAINRLVVSLKDTSATAEEKEWLVGHLPQAEVHSWDELALYYRQVVQLYSNIFFIFGVIILSVVFLSIVNTMLMSIMERTREIGTLLAIGIGSRFVSSLFVVEGGLIGLLGGTLGALAASVLALIVNGAGLTMPPAPGRTLPYPLTIFVDPASMSLAILFVAVISCFAAFLPSFRSSRSSIVDSLNHT